MSQHIIFNTALRDDLRRTNNHEYFGRDIMVRSYVVSLCVEDIAQEVDSASTSCRGELLALLGFIPYKAEVGSFEKNKKALEKALNSREIIHAYGTLQKDYSIKIERVIFPKRGQVSIYEANEELEGALSEAEEQL